MSEKMDGERLDSRHEAYDIQGVQEKWLSLATGDSCFHWYHDDFV
ncbi:MAG: hypothetical protein ACKO29_04975 [Actinomycetota bacterium]